MRQFLWRAAMLVGLLLAPSAGLRAQDGAATPPAQLPGLPLEEPTSPRLTSAVTFMQINDVYSMVPVNGQGGLARVATLRKEIAASGHTPFMVIAGDFISPSVASTIFKGEHMIAALNSVGLDLATLGNHELDFGPEVLARRMSESTFTWVVSNVVDTKTNKPVGNAVPYLVKTFGDLKVGFIGLCLTTEQITPDNLGSLKLINPIDAAGIYIPILKEQGVDFIVAVTHLSFPEDRALAVRFPEIDLIIGGHEHVPLTAVENRTLISKAGSDAKYVARIDVNRRPPSTIERVFELIPITETLPEDLATKAVIDSYESRLGKEMNVVIGTSEAGLDAISVNIRAHETNLSDLVADAMRKASGADVVILNSGGIRGDRVYPPGPLTRATLITMLPFGNVLCTVAVPGSVVLDALNAGVSHLPASEGRLPAVSGLTMRVNMSAPSADHRVSDVRVGGEPLDPNKIYKVATTDYQLKGGDGYGMLASGQTLVGPESGPIAATALEQYVASLGDFTPKADGRIQIVR